MLSTRNGCSARRAQDNGLAPPTGLFPNRQHALQISYAAEVMHLKWSARAAARFAPASAKSIDQIIWVFDPPRTCRDVVHNRTRPEGLSEMLQSPQFDAAKLATNYRANLVVRPIPQTPHGSRCRRPMSHRQRLHGTAEHDKLQQSQGALVVVGQRIVVRESTEL